MDGTTTAPKIATARDVMGLGPFIPVVTIEDAADGPALARALLAGGLRSVEVTLRTPQALDAIHAIAAQVPEIVVGAGTLLAPADVTRARKAGARFGVSPGFTISVSEAAREAEFPLLPGAVTPSEIMAARERGFTALRNDAAFAEIAEAEVLDLDDAVRQDPVFARTHGENKGRDGCRVPIPWSGRAASYGFGDGAASWLPQPASWSEIGRAHV